MCRRSPKSGWLGPGAGVGAVKGKVQCSEKGTGVVKSTTQCSEKVTGASKGAGTGTTKRRRAAQRND